MWEELWQDHYTETYWFYYNSYLSRQPRTSGHAHDTQFAEGGQEDMEVVFSTEFVVEPSSADQQNDGEGRVDRTVVTHHSGGCHFSGISLISGKGEVPFRGNSHSFSEKDM